MNTLNSYRRSRFIFTMAGLFLTLYGCKNTKQDYSPPSTVSVMTYNIRYDNPGDSLNSWDYRKEQLANEVLFYNPDFMGIQEGLHHQVQYLADHLEDRKFIGVGRKDGKTGGEYSAIFYNDKQYSLIPGSDSTIWLSETPGKPSKGWDAALPRIVTWGKFRSKTTGKELYVFNTHFDHRGRKARAKSAELILQTIKEIADTSPVVLTGDFNVPEENDPYKVITSSFMRDAWYHSALPPIGPKATFRGFKVCNPSSWKARIDFIFVNKALTVNKIATISNFRGDSFLSDHLPVFSVLSWKK